MRTALVVQTLLLFFQPFFSRGSPSSESNEQYENPVQISATHLDYDTKTIVVREHKRLMVTCVYDSDDIADISDVQWRREGGEPIDESSSPSLFTVGLKDHKSHHKKKNLHFASVHKRDEGTYVCRGKNLDGKVYESRVNIDVLDSIAWNDVTTDVGALAGEPLTIDCGVKKKGGKDPQIEITAGNGEALDSELFTIAGTEVTVQELTSEFNEKVVSCVHVELANGNSRDYPVVDRKDVRIHVWGKPEFDDVVKDQYTIISDTHPQTVALFCNVTASNPPATHFVFYRGTDELSDPMKYSLTKHIGRHQGAELKIFDVNTDDLGEYRCEVNNGKAKASQTIHLKEASPPKEPKVKMALAKKHSISFQVESQENEEELPVKEISIQYLRRALLDDADIDEDDKDALDSLWEKKAAKIIRHQNKENIYEVTGLRKGSEYLFKFRQLSQAGAGDSNELSAFTEDDEPDDDDAKPSYLKMSLALPLLLILLC